MFILTRISGFGSCDIQNTISKKVSSSFSNADWENAWLFENFNQVVRHKFTIGCPGRILVGYPFNEHFNTNTVFLCPPRILKATPVELPSAYHQVPNSPNVFVQIFLTAPLRRFPPLRSFYWTPFHWVVTSPLLPFSN